MGFLPLDRGVKDHWVYKDSQYLHVWLEMLLTARFSEEPKTTLHEGELVTVEYGEFIFGRLSWSERFGISEQRLRTLINKMKKEEMIVPTKKYRRSTVYLIKKYGEFNQQKFQENQLLEKKQRDTNQQTNQQESLEHQRFEVDANQHDNATSTIYQPAPNQQVTTKEESNKVIIKESKYIYDYWNSKKIKVHRELTKVMEGHINARLEARTLQEILDSIDAYHEIISDQEKYWYGHKFTLTDFMNPKNLDRFMLENKPYESHLNNKGGGNNGKYGGSTKEAGSERAEKASQFAFLDENKGPTGIIEYDPDIF